MPAAAPDRSRLRTAFEFFTLATAAGSLETLLTGCPPVVTALAKSLATVAGGVAPTYLTRKTADAKATRAFLAGPALPLLPARVLSALISDYAESAATGAAQKALRKLAGKLPAWWQTETAKDGELAAALSGPHFTQKLAHHLQPESSPVMLPADTVEAILTAAAGSRSGIPAGVLQHLAGHIAAVFGRSLTATLTSGSPDTTPAFREALLHFQARTIAGLQDLGGKFDDLFDAFISANDGLESALQQFRASLDHIKQTGDDTNRRTRKIDRRLSTSEKDRRLRDYLAALAAGFRGYTEIGIEKRTEGEDEAPPIWKIFVPPSCTSGRALSPREMEDAQNAQPPTTPAVPLLPLLADENVRRHVLLGDPGMGKSTLIQLLTAGLAAGQSIPGAPALNTALPIPFILRDIVPHLPEDPVTWNWSTLCDTLRKKYQRSEDAPCLFCPWPDLRSLCDELFRSPHAFFLVDGLDEIGDTAKRTAIRDAIWEGLRTYPQARWLVTSRLVGYDLARVDMDVLIQPSAIKDDTHTVEDKAADYFAAKWGTLWDVTVTAGVDTDSSTVKKSGAVSAMPLARLHYLAPFDNAQQEAFVSNWFRERRAPNPPPGLLGDIRSRDHDGIRVLARVPNLLSYMAILKRDSRPLPDGRAELYTAIARAYLHSIDKAYRLSKSHGHDCPIPFEGRLRLLSILAGEMQHRRSAAAEAWEAERIEKLIRAEALGITPAEAEGNIVIGEAEVRALLHEPLRRLLPESDADQELADFLKFIAHRSGLLLPRGSDPEGAPLYGFTHLSFLEYFAACYLRDELEHEKDMRGAATDEQTTPDDPAFATRYLTQYPRGPRHLQRRDLPSFAARPEWHEVLIFLAEFSYDKPRQRDPLLRALFPFLHSTDEIPIRTLDYSNFVLLIPDNSACLAIKLARDAHLALPPATRLSWMTRLWDAWLSFRIRIIDVHPSKINTLLLSHPDYEIEALAALAAAAPRHHDLASLCLEDCLGLTDSGFILTHWPKLKALSLWGCTGLRTVDALPDSLTLLYLNGCTGLQTVDKLPTSLTKLYLNRCTGLLSVDALPASLTSLSLIGCTGLSAEAVARVKARLPECRIIEP